MKIPVMKDLAGDGWRKQVGATAVVLLMAGAIAGWASSIVPTTSTAAVDFSDLTDARNATAEELKPRLTGSYRVTGTDPDGTPYAGTATLAIALAPSGALELTWDNGKQVGVGQVVGNVLAVAGSIKGRTVILLMTINPDGSLSGKWSRRTDRGNKGTEIWRKT
jgi:hypothetical protein